MAGVLGAAPLKIASINVSIKITEQRYSERAIIESAGQRLLAAAFQARRLLFSIARPPSTATTSELKAAGSGTMLCTAATVCVDGKHSSCAGRTEDDSM